MKPTRAETMRRRGAGFTLIEILVALAIVALALGAVVAETGHYIAAMARMQDRTLAHWIAVDRVTEAQLAGAWPSTGNTDGSVEFSGREWLWTLRVSETPNDDMRRLDVEVRAATDEEDIVATAIGYLRRPDA
ncbi:MAG: type II secretion system minor pseudopilin GspI [Gammaproteobacteria bacterium]|jgi:general secretion pathway protein I|nr:type II secretion system minor pseudopilin GspI [Gammaproteobacteria bacterium]